MPNRALTIVTDEKLKSGDTSEASTERKIFDIEGSMLGDRINGLNLSVSDISCLYCWNMRAFNANSKPTTPLY